MRCVAKAYVCAVYGNGDMHRSVRRRRRAQFKMRYATYAITATARAFVCRGMAVIWPRKSIGGSGGGGVEEVKHDMGVTALCIT